MNLGDCACCGEQVERWEWDQYCWDCRHNNCPEQICNVEEEEEEEEEDWIAEENAYLYAVPAALSEGERR